jgi:flagellum-specific peptidoglycan hydrolase FlgJ
MNKNTKNILFFAAIGVGLLLLFQKQVKTVISLTTQKLAEIMSVLKGYTQNQAIRAFQAGTALKQLGLNDEQIGWVMAQIAFETGHYKNNSAINDNNLSGIKYVGQKNATPGTPAPKNEGSAPYAHYNSINDWANDYLRIMKTVGKYRPLDAPDSTEFVKRLKANGYFGGDLNNYISGVNSLVRFYKPFIQLL